MQNNPRKSLSKYILLGNPSTIRIKQTPMNNNSKQLPVMAWAFFYEEDPLYLIITQSAHAEKFWVITDSPFLDNLLDEVSLLTAPEILERYGIDITTTSPITIA